MDNFLEKAIYIVKQRKSNKLIQKLYKAGYRMSAFTKKALDIKVFGKPSNPVLFAKAQYVKVKPSDILISPVEMTCRMDVDRLEAHYDACKDTPVYLIYWRSQNLLIHVDGYHRICYYIYCGWPTIRANILDIEMLKGRILTEKEVYEVVCDEFQEQNNGTVRLKAYDKHEAALGCSNAKISSVAYAIKVAMDNGYNIDRKGERKTAASIGYTQCQEIAVYGVDALLFAVDIASKMAKRSNDEMRTLKNLVEMLVNSGNRDKFDACKDALIPLLAEKEIMHIYTMTSDFKSRKAYLNYTASQLFEYLEEEGVLR